MTAKTTKAKPVASAMPLLVGVKAIETALMSIAKRGAELQHDTHVAACSVLQHVGKHSDVRLIESLLTAVPDMTRKNAIRAWFEEFGPVMFEDEKAVFVKGKRTLVGDAWAKPFWSFKPEEKYVPLDLAAAFKSFVKKLEKDQKKVEGRNHSALIAQLSKLAPANAVAA